MPGHDAFLRWRAALAGVLARLFHRHPLAFMRLIDISLQMAGVLTHGDLDNGRGLARQKLFTHKHEVCSFPLPCASTIALTGACHAPHMTG